MKKKTLGKTTAEELMKLIFEKGYTSGDRLPNEYELSSLLNVGRNTIREAVRTLATRNILDIRQGAGTFISDKKGIIEDPLGFSLMKDRYKLVEDLLQVRCIIEPQIAALAAQNADNNDIEILEGLCIDIEVLINEKQNFSKKDMEFHAHLAKCSKNKVMSNLIPVICEGVTIFSSVVNEQEFNQTIKSHREIFESIREHRPTDAQQAMLFHLLYNRNRFKEEKNS